MELKIKYDKSSYWNIDLRDQVKLYHHAKEEINHALKYDNFISVSSPYEAEAIWLIARCMKINNFKFYTNNRDSDGYEEVDKDKFWRLFSQPLREFDILRIDIESWEKGVDEDCPLDIDDI